MAGVSTKYPGIKLTFIKNLESQLSVLGGHCPWGGNASASSQKLRTQRKRITNHKSTSSIVLNVLPRDAFLWQENIQMQTYYYEFKK